MRVSFVAEQLLQPIPGGIGTYVRAMLRRLPPTGVELEPVVAFHRAAALADAGVPHARRLRLPRSMLYRRWMFGRGGSADGHADLVHAPSLAFPPRGDRPLVVTVHDTLFMDQPEAFTDRGVEFHQAMLQRLGEADIVITPSKATASSLDDHVREERIRVVPMGTDLQAPPDQERDEVLERLEVQRPYVLWMGTLEPRKNPEGVVRGFAHALEAQVPDADELSLYLVGPPGWWSGDLVELLEEKGIRDRVRRIDSQPVPVRAALYAGARAFLFPSFGEGFGLPVLEAMACGAPVVTSNRSSLPEVAGSAAELCDPDDPNSIGQALGKVLRDPDLASDLVRLGRQRATDLTWDATARRTLDAYREALG